MNTVKIIVLVLLVTVATAHAQPDEPGPAPAPVAPSPPAPPAPPSGPEPPAPPMPPGPPSPSSLPATPTPPSPPEPVSPAAPPIDHLAHEHFTPSLQIHGFASEGAFVSTANDYIGYSSRGSLEYFEAAVNVSTELTDKLHAGLQLFSQDEGTANDATPRLDWAYLDYHWQSWLGLRAGRVRIPFGLYNDYIDIDAARVQILLPQSVYPFDNRNVLTAQNGFALYGSLETKGAGSFDYQAYAGVLSIPLPGAQDANSTRAYAYDSKYIIGGQLFWHPPVDGLRVGGSVLQASLDESVNLAPSLTAVLIATGMAPATFDGNLTISLQPAQFWIGSADYVHGDWMFAAEYSRWLAHTTTSPINLDPTANTDQERFYALATYQLARKLSAGVYYSVLYDDVNDRSGSDKTTYPKPYDAWSRDATLSLRYDINDHWLWKAEAHFIDGAASIDTTIDAMPQRYWGLFLIRTTVTF
jgi:hypothetical protein